MANFRLLLLLPIGVLARRLTNNEWNVIEQVWKTCLRKGKVRETQMYRFQIIPQNDNGEYIAGEFKRSDRDPALILHYHQEWALKPSYRLDYETKSYLAKYTWEPTPIQGNGSEMTPYTKLIDLLNGVKSITYSAEYSEAGPALIVRRKDADPFELYGGLYFAEVSVDLALDIYLRKHSDKLGEEQFKVLTIFQDLVKPVKGQHISRQLTPAEEKARRFLVKFGATAAGVPAFVLGLPVSVLAVAAASAIPGAAGVAVGGVGVTAHRRFTAGAYNAVARRTDVLQFENQREIELSPPQKIFEKMRCHRQFKRCGDVTIVPSREGDCDSLPSKPRA